MPADTGSAEVGTSFPQSVARPRTLGAEGLLRLVRPEIAVGTAIVLAVIGYAALAHLVASPRIFTDELAYWDSAASLADGQLLNVRGERYELGPLYPGLLAVLLSLAPDREVAYELAKFLNALLFALTAIPLYLLARRVLRPWPSAGVAALGILVPSAMYVSVVMTESVAYLAGTWALLAIVVTLERPTLARQGMTLAAIALASAARLQFLVLIPAYLLALGLVLLLARGKPRRGAGELWPTALACALAVAAFGAWGVLSGVWAPDLIGDYSALWRTYDLAEVGGWLVYHLADLELYLAVVPVAVAPIVGASFLRRAREGSSPHAAFVALFLSVNAAVLLLAAAFNTTEYSHDRLHDRYTFYLVPLWLVVLFAWLQDGAPRPLVAASLGGSIALLLPTLIPYSEYAREDGAQRFAGVASTLWAAIQTAVADESFVVGEVVLLTTVAGLVALAFLLPRRLAEASVAVVALTFVVTAELAWYLAIRDGTNWAFANTLSGRRWVDESVPSGRFVTSLTIDYPCEKGLVGGDSFHRTEFFNRSVARAAHLGRRQTQLPSTKVHLARDGVLRLTSGSQLRADYVLTVRGVSLQGRRIAEGTVSRLALWEVNGPVRIVGIEAFGQPYGGACPPALRLAGTGGG